MLNKPDVFKLVGNKYGKLTVIDFDHQEGRRFYYLCKCNCGNICIKSNDSLLKNKLAPSCGCIKEELAKTDIIGKKFNKLTVLECDHIDQHKSIPNKKVYYFKCKCDCGNEIILPKEYITYGKVRSCGKCTDSNESVSNFNHDLMHIEFSINGFVRIIEENKVMRVLNDPRELINTNAGQITILNVVGIHKRNRLDYDYIYECKCNRCGSIFTIPKANLLRQLNNPDFSCSNCRRKKIEDVKIESKPLYCPIHFINKENK